MIIKKLIYSILLGSAVISIATVLLRVSPPTSSRWGEVGGGTFHRLSSAADRVPSESLEQAMQDTPLQHALKHADVTYVCPMHPQIVRAEPGSCPLCGMALEARIIQTGGGATEFGPPIVTIRPETLQNMGVRIAPVERTAMQRRIDTVGTVAYDEERIAHVHARAEGWVEKLVVRSEGAVVKAGQPLLEVYSPAIVNAQEEYLLALDGVATPAIRGRNMVAAGRRRLQLLNVPDAVIQTLEKTRQVQDTVPILAPMSGVVTAIGLREGMYIMPATELFTLSDVSSVWVQVDVFGHHQSWVTVGLPAEIQVPSLPGRRWQGQVDYLYPELNPQTRTLRVRLRFTNPDGLLRPNMFAEAVIRNTPKTVLSIPREALIISGGQERVIQALGDGRFQPTTVVTGLSVADRVEILEGLEAGQNVVVSGQFLIDSESNLQASFRRMQGLPTSEADDATEDLHLPSHPPSHLHRH